MDRKISARTAAWLALMLVASAGGQVSEAPPDNTPPQNPFALPPLPADAPKPAPDPRNLEGAWIHLDPPVRNYRTDDGGPLPYRPGAKAILAHRQARSAQGRPVSNPSALCRPPGITWDFELNFPFVIVQRPDETAFVFEEFHSIWRIFMGDAPTSAPPLTYGGRSYGHWEGDVLVVRTTGLREETWIDIDGSPHSSSAVMQHRIRKSGSGDTLDIELTVDDPVMYTRPWTITRHMTWRPDRKVLSEFDCEESTGSAAEAARFHVYSDDAPTGKQK
jgi:hypothetical protein